jgi:hypothetical protein
MKLNAGKCQALCFDHKGQQIGMQLQIGSTDINSVTALRYLGIQWELPLNFKTHIETHAMKASNLLFLLRISSGYYRGYRRQVLLKIYLLYIRPILEFGCLVYAYFAKSYFTALERVEKTALRLILGVSATTSIDAMYTEADITPIRERMQQVACATYLRFVTDNITDKLVPQLSMEYANMGASYTASLKGSQLGRVADNLNQLLSTSGGFIRCGNACSLNERIIIDTSLLTITSTQINQEMQERFTGFDNATIISTVFAYGVTAAGVETSAVGLQQDGREYAFRIQDGTKGEMGSLSAIAAALNISKGWRNGVVVILNNDYAVKKKRNENEIGRVIFIDIVFPMNGLI